MWVRMETQPCYLVILIPVVMWTYTGATPPRAPISRMIILVISQENPSSRRAQTRSRFHKTASLITSQLRDLHNRRSTRTRTRQSQNTTHLRVFPFPRCRTSWLFEIYLPSGTVHHVPAAVRPSTRLSGYVTTSAVVTHGLPTIVAPRRKNVLSCLR